MANNNTLMNVGKYLYWVLLVLMFIPFELIFNTYVGTDSLQPLYDGLVIGVGSLLAILYWGV